MKTTHSICFCDAAHMASIESGSVDLVVTSPPYPMIEMWDSLFCDRDPAVAAALGAGDGPRAFELMHSQLDPVWSELFRVLRDGGIACINVGDATRTIDRDFQLYPNHSRILQQLRAAGFSALPDILWRKQTNAPNKFMGSGMLPAGAYVTLEHEYLLILRKGRKRAFGTSAHKRMRAESALFWEERNSWFSDVWMDIKGTGQELHDKAARARSAAFPFEIAHRIISMYSVKGDTVLDPFFGSGTTGAVAKKLHRHWIGIEREEKYISIAQNRIDSITPELFADEIFDVRDKKRLAPRVKFGLLLETGLLAPGQILFFRKDRSKSAQIKANAKLRLGDGFEGSIHQVGRHLMGGNPCNGWQHWYYDSKENGLSVIDELRETYRKEYMQPQAS